MDKEILEWFGERAEDWRSLSSSTVFTWGNGSNNQLGHSTNDNVSASPVPAWKDIQMVRMLWSLEPPIEGLLNFYKGQLK